MISIGAVLKMLKDLFALLAEYFKKLFGKDDAVETTTPSTTF